MEEIVRNNNKNSTTIMKTEQQILRLLKISNAMTTIQKKQIRNKQKKEIK